MSASLKTRKYRSAAYRALSISGGGEMGVRHYVCESNNDSEVPQCHI
jgi:hypothetical protein